MIETFEGIEGIILDAVGTLIDPKVTVAESYAEAARRQGVVLDVGEVRARFRHHFARDEFDEARGPMSTDEAVEKRRWRNLVGRCLPEVPDPDRAFDELWDYFGDPHSWRVFDDVAPAVIRLRAEGFRLCVGSNFDARLRKVLAGLEPLADWAGPVVISSEVGFRKPHPEFYRAACGRLGLDPGRVLSVGDDRENDVGGPIRAGLRGLLIDRAGRSEGGLRPDRTDGGSGRQGRSPVMNGGGIVDKYRRAGLALPASVFRIRVLAL